MTQVRGHRQLMLDPAMATLQAIPDEVLEHGEVFTRRWIVDLILDLAGYSAERDLATMVAVEPACGGGAFLGPMVERLSSSCRKHGHALGGAKKSIRAFDLLTHNVETSRGLVEKILVEDEWDAAEAADAAEAWVREGDYLLSDDEVSDADFVIGNPPYIRLEDVPSDRMAAYRTACKTMIGRADVYIGFFEVGLRSLAPGGTLAFICADRWMRNQYGRELRQLVTNGFGVNALIVMHEIDAFEEKVAAYPAITVLQRSPQGPVVIADVSRKFDVGDATELVKWARRAGHELADNDRFQAARLPRWLGGSESWPTGSPARLALIEELNGRFLPLEDPQTGTRVGIGVATGADSVFVAKQAAVEPDRLTPLSMVRDTTSGVLSWSGHFLVNPWDDGALIDLDDYPLLKAYFEKHGEQLRGRHIATKMPSRWFRTIDKVDMSLVARPKLLFPDMKLTIHPVLDEGGLYPHHNLYYVVSDQWDLRVLGGLLLSRVAEAFVEAYAVKMRGGTLRFQAQYLRRIRVPHPSGISPEDRTVLADAFLRRDVFSATEAAARVYGIENLTGALLDGSRSIRPSSP